MKDNNIKRKISILFIDLEAQYTVTIQHIKELLEENIEYLQVYWVCLPINLRNSLSVFQLFWTC
jgi:predicted phosphoadenosine phosphosulfate sulfurtransferase